MTQEEKQLLFKDLCARLPYGIKCHEDDVEYSFDIIGTITNSEEFVFSDGYERSLEQIKPYLRPMSSMTEDERKEYMCLSDLITVDGVLVSSYETFDWLIKKHFDFRGLIPKGLALEAPEGMYN